VDNVRVLRLPPEIIGQFYDGEVSFPVIVYGGVDGDKVVAAGGLMWRDGRCCGWVDVFTDVSSRKITLVRWCKRMLRMAGQIGETEVYIVRDEQQPNSEKLLRLLGFEFVELQAVTGKEIYRVRL
jgi:hypothetical protein